jgi:RNA polymerase sigma-70 factor (ECF subfamily)
MTPQERDLECLLRLQARDASGLEMLYDAYAATLYGVALRILRDAADAEDVVQETWTQVWKASATYDPHRGAVAAWLLTIARSRALDRYRSASARKRAHDSAEAGAPPPAPLADPGADSEQAQLAARIRQALETLPAEQRQVLELAYFGGLSQSEVAARLGKPLGTVKSWTRQGLSRLREAMPRAQWT